MSYLARLKAKIAETPLPDKLTELTKGASVSSVSPQGGGFCRNAPGKDALAESVRDALEERATLCAGVIPAAYLDAWARLNHQRPLRVSDDDWRRALDDGGRFLDAWGWVSESDWAWTVGELFDIPRVGNPGGLIWQLQGALVEAYGPDHVRLSDSRTIKREEKGLNDGA